MHFFNFSSESNSTFKLDKKVPQKSDENMIRKHITTNEMVKKLLNVIEKRVGKSKENDLLKRRNLETTL